MRMLGALLLGLMPVAAVAQMPSSQLVETVPEVPEIRMHGDWRVACVAAGCTAEPLAQVAPLVMGIAREGETEVLVLRAPLGLLLAEGVAVSVDGRAIGRLAFLTCEVDGCVAPVRLEGALRSALRGGRELVLTIVRRDGAAIEARYSLIGFIAATGDLGG
jgi:invasion protein IalB